MYKLKINKNPLKTELFSFRMPILLREELEKIALENKVSISKVIRYSLEKTFEIK